MLTSIQTNLQVVSSTLEQIKLSLLEFVRISLIYVESINYKNLTKPERRKTSKSKWNSSKKREIVESAFARARRGSFEPAWRWKYREESRDNSRFYLESRPRCNLISEFRCIDDENRSSSWKEKKRKERDEGASAVSSATHVLITRST